MFSFRNGVPASIIVVKMIVIAHPEIGSCEKCFTVPGSTENCSLFHCFKRLSRKSASERACSEF